MDKNREAFESAYSKFYDYEIRFEKAISGYRYKHENAAWWAWQASRQAIEVELPEAAYSRPELTTCASYWIKKCAEAITSLGIRVKGSEE